MEIRNKISIGSKTFAFVRVKDLTISKYNVRPEITPEDKEEIRTELAKSIRELGLQQLPVVTPEGEVFIGGRRTVAFKELGEEWMLAEIREATPFEQLVASYTENFHRKAPNFMEEGKLFKQMCEIGQVSAAQLAKKLGLSDTTILSKIKAWEKLHDLPGGETITFEQARMITSSDISDDVRKKLVERLKDGMKTDTLTKAIARTNAVKSLLDGEPEELKKKALQRFEDQFYSEELDMGEVLWFLEEWNKDSHKLTEGIKMGNEINAKTFEEANAWFNKYGGYCLGPVTNAWYGMWDHKKEELEKKKRLELEE